MAASVANVINLGPCTVSFSSTDLGHVSGVEVTIAEKINEAKIDLAGDAPVAAFTGGITIEAKMTMEESLLASLDAVSNQMALVTGTATGSGAIKLAAGQACGVAITGALLTLTPVDSGKSTKVFAIYKAFVASHSKKIAISPEKQAQWEVVFRGLYDDSRTTGDRLFSFGVTTAQVGTAA